MTLPNVPRPPKLLRMLRTLKLIFRPLDTMQERVQRYGDIFTIGGENSPPFVQISNPQAIKEIFTADAELFQVGRGNRGLRFLLGDRSLILLDGESHQRQRKLLMPPFHGDRLRTYSQLICDIAEQVTNQWIPAKPFRVRSYMQEITLRVILQAVFGLHEGQRYEQLREVLSSLLESFGSPLSSSLIFFQSLQKDWGAWSPWGRYVRLKQQAKQLIYDEIRERRDSEDFSRDDILTLMMSARDEAGEAMSDEELHDELMTLLIAGHETTASALVWALYWIHHLPEVYDKLLHELDTLGNGADPMEIARLPYLTAVCQETLRIYPIVPGAFIRVLRSPMQLMGYQFPEGTAFMLSIFSTHQRADIYPEPKRFKPERFLERQYSPYEYLPFGGGNRRCLGAALAQLEMKLVLASIVSRFELALTDKRPVKPVRRGLTLAPPGNMQMVVTQRRQITFAMPPESFARPLH